MLAIFKVSQINYLFRFGEETAKESKLNQFHFRPGEWFCSHESNQEIQSKDPQFDQLRLGAGERPDSSECSEQTQRKYMTFVHS